MLNNSSSPKTNQKAVSTTAVKNATVKIGNNAVASTKTIVQNTTTTAKNTASSTISVIGKAAETTGKNIGAAVIQGVGAAAIKTTSIVSTSTAKYMTKPVSNEDLTAIVRQTIGGSAGENVKKLMEHTIDSMVEEQLRKSAAPITQKYSEAMHLYNKIYHADDILIKMKENYSSNLSKVTANKVTSFADKLTNPLNNNSITRGFINQSALNAELTNFVNVVIGSAIDGVATNDDIRSMAGQVRNEIDLIKANSMKYAMSKFGTDINNAIKITKVAKEQMVLLEKKKMEYMKMATDALNTQRQKINEAVLKLEAKAAEEINKVVKSLLSGLTKGIKIG